MLDRPPPRDVTATATATAPMIAPAVTPATIAPAPAATVPAAPGPAAPVSAAPVSAAPVLAPLAAPPRIEAQQIAAARAETPAAPPITSSLSLEPGLYRCELDRRVTVRRLSADRQTLVINWQGKDAPLQAVTARTGALRFENIAAGLVWLTIVGKSMLLDSKVGRTLANECNL